MPALAKIHIGYVDVRDVAKAHILAMTNSASDGERFIVSEKEMWLHESAEVLNNAGYQGTIKSYAELVSKDYGDV